MKRIFALLLSAILSIGVLSACGPSAQPSKTPENSPAAAGTPAGAQTDSPDEIAWPERDITVVISANAGGGSDITGRITNKYLQEELGVNVVTVNVAGAGGSLGARQVMDSDADGYTLAYHNDGLISSYVVGSCDFDYTAFKWSGICALCNNVVFATTNRFSSFEEMVAYAKEHPGELRYGVQSGNYQEQMAAMLMKSLGIELQIVDVGSVADILVAMLGGHVDMTCGPMGTVKEYIESGDIIAQGVLAEERYPDYPELRTMTELGVNYVLPKYFIYYFPADTDDAIIDKFNEALQRVCSNEAYIAEMKAQDFDAVYMSPEEAGEYQANALAMFQEYQKVLDEYNASK